ncbi:hypothetical protein EBO15_22225 [Actinomadura harenae]|uniref:PH domain-containing protein n=2 Tax=Actinomadura harenae TaxID=2483351 RepID=A0A3M2LXQ2_9ACTN|nr:hypothetical protein EBO15_22225 [Actinomadura harenae]
MPAPAGPTTTWTGLRWLPFGLPVFFVVIFLVATGGDPGVLGGDPQSLVWILWFVLLVVLPLAAAVRRRIILGPASLVVRRTFRTHTFRLSEITFLQPHMPTSPGPRWPKLLVRSSGQQCYTWNLGPEHERIVQTVRDAVIQAGGADPLARD